ncbi:MAG TPA: hypothetical protein VK619_18540 [Pyrinomonadaceae bacterium]|nr:hypothetical protein [Pyrinomonadaceae bacterium]
MMRVFPDIETLPPDQNATAAISSLESRSDEEFRDLALSGDWGRVLTIGVVVEKNGEELHRGLLGRERQTMMFHLDEARTLRAFWKLLRGFNTKRDLVVGHNIFDFDLLFLYKRSIIQRVRPSVSLLFARYRSQPIFDTMYEWEKWRWSRKHISLDELARVPRARHSAQGGQAAGVIGAARPPRTRGGRGSLASEIPVTCLPSESQSIASVSVISHSSTL